MSNSTPKIGKKGAIKDVAKKLTELRKKPLSGRVFEIVKEDAERRRNKKVAKAPKDIEI